MADHFFGVKQTSPSTDSSGAVPNTYETLIQRVAGSECDTWHLVAANQKLADVWFYAKAVTNDPTGLNPGTVTAALYVMDFSTKRAQARIGTKFTFSTSSSAAAALHLSVDIDLSAYVGQYVKLCGGFSTGGAGVRPHFQTLTFGEARSSPSDTPTPLASASDRTNAMLLWGNIVDVAPQTITSVNSGNPVKIGSTVPVSVNGFSKAITKGILDGVALSAASATSITLPALVDEQTAPRVGSGRVLVLSSADDTETATVNIPVAVPDGLASEQIIAGFNTGEANSIAYLFNPPLLETDNIYFDPTKGTVTPIAGYNGNYDGVQILWHHKASTKVARSFTLITGAGVQTQFSFSSVDFAPMATLVESNTVEVVEDSLVSIVGGEYSVNPGVWISASSTVNSGSSIKVRLQSKNAPGEVSRCTLTIGAFSATFTVTTSATPDTGGNIMIVNGNNPIEAGEQFTVTFDELDARDVTLVVLEKDSDTYYATIDTVDSATQLTATAPDNLPANTLVTIRVYESKHARLVRELA